MSAQVGWMRCEGCGRTAPWKPEFAGRRFRCKCGQIITAPSEPPIAEWPDDPTAAAKVLSHRDAVLRAPTADVVTHREVVRRPAREAPAAADDGDAGYDLADDPPMARRAPPHALPHSAPHPAAHAPLPPPDDAFVAPQPAMAMPPDAAPHVGGVSPTLAYRRFGRRTEEQAEETRQIVSYQRREMILPAALIALGLLLTFFEARLVIGQWSVLAIVFYAVFTTIINLALIFTALMITSKLLDLGLGELGPAVLKICAVAILPAAVSGIIDAGLRPHAGFFAGFVAWTVALLLYFFLLWLHFDMDFQEMAICTTLIWVIRTWVGMAIFMLLFKASFGGSITNPLYSGDDEDDADNAPLVVPDDGWDDDDDPMPVPPFPQPDPPATAPATQPVP